MPFARNKTPQLSPTDAAAQAGGGTLVLIDVREPDERRAARPPGSLHIPLADLPARLDELPRDRTAAFICRSGNRSAKAARVAADHGRTGVNVRGGLLAWTRAGLPVESGPESSATTAREAR
jgi:rhodanese-related sulfurtransferase